MHRIPPESFIIVPSMEKYNQRVEALAELMKEFGLAEAELKGDGWAIALRKARRAAPTPAPAEFAMISVDSDDSIPAPVIGPAAPSGVPITSPMTGIYYASPSPSAPAFVKEGEQVTAGQVVGLIEAMKVFNEIVAITSGTVSKIAAESGQLVSPGDPLVYIV